MTSLEAENEVLQLESISYKSTDVYHPNRCIPVIFLLLFCFIIAGSLILPIAEAFDYQSNYDYYGKDILNYDPQLDSLLSMKVSNLRKRARNQRCQFKGNSPENDSTKEDLIIGCILKKVAGYLSFMYSLSATLTNATIIILTDNDTFPKLPLLNLSMRYKVISIGKIPSRFTNPVFTYKVILFHFLSLYGHLFKRIICTDVTDVVFQQDPFNKDINFDIINFGFEHYTLKEQATNVKWVNEVGGWMLNNKMETEQVNCGVIAGNSEIMRRLSIFTLYMWNAHGFLRNGADQGVIEYLMLNHFMQDNGVEFTSKGRGHITVFTFGDFSTKDAFPFTNNRQSDDYCSLLHKLRYGDKVQIKKLCQLNGVRDALR